MKKLILTGFFAAAFTTAAFAAEKFFVTVDSVGNCSVVRSDGTLSAGKTALGDSGGYASMEDAKKFLDGIRNDESKCKGVVAG